MKKIIVGGITFLLPFLLVWVAFVMTGFVFHPHSVFSSGAFWGISICYWFIWLCLIGHVLEDIEG